MPTNTAPSAPKRSLQALDRLNLSLGDVRDVFEPYLAIFLTAERQFDPAQVGIILAIANIAGIIAQTPIGAVVDASKYKRQLIAISSVAIAIGYLMIINVRSFPVILLAQAGIGIAAVTIIPAVSAISLGLVGQERFSRRIGRNETFHRSGNVVTAIIAGILAQITGLAWIFYLLIFLCIATTILVFQIRDRDIDNTAARAGGDDRSQTSGMDLLKDRPLLTFGLAVFLFYAANAALPLLSQHLTGGQATAASGFISAFIGVAQLTTIPVVIWASKAADVWGRKPLLLVAFAATTVRALLYGLNANPWFVLWVQTLDGLAAGILAVAIAIVVADLTKGTGRFNLAQGGIYTTIGIGAAVGNLASGFLAKTAGFPIAFLMLSAVAALGSGWLWFAMPETK
ncbi:MFS transporter [Chamaesiphon sp.]|uniref:MFS transporter n=1 Tax=Chamaesiphon sp. TaxID=2814140 RepID=UPI003593FEE0